MNCWADAGLQGSQFMVPSYMTSQPGPLRGGMQTRCNRNHVFQKVLRLTTCLQSWGGDQDVWCVLPWCHLLSSPVLIVDWTRWGLQFLRCSSSPAGYHVWECVWWKPGGKINKKFHSFFYLFFCMKRRPRCSLASSFFSFLSYRSCVGAARRDHQRCGSRSARGGVQLLRIPEEEAVLQGPGRSVRRTKRHIIANNARAESQMNQNMTLGMMGCCFYLFRSRSRDGQRPPGSVWSSRYVVYSMC